ncbi:MAG: cell division protein FtsA [Verrucomicrobia bacterium]|nr:cell division protein FtsA [Verrucomicrobiota bacterium]
MFSSHPDIVVGLEIGTSKVCAAVGVLNADGTLNLIGVGQARSRGVRKGEIVDAANAAEDIRNAVAEAEAMADVEIRNVYLGVTGAHLCGFNNRGRHNIASPDRDITVEDVEDVVRNAKAINLAADHHVMHVVRQHYTVDGQAGVVNPVGMLGVHLEVDVHVVHGATHRLQNAIRVVKELQLEVNDIVFNGIASSLAVLTAEEKELGALVIDVGAGTTEYVVYANGIIKHTGVLAVGGDHVTNDLAYGLKLTMTRAEAMKLEHGAAVADGVARGQAVPLSRDLSLPERLVNLEHLRRIMSVRLEEIFEIISEELEPTGLLDYLRAGVFLSGGGARVPEMARLAQRVFGLPVVLGRTRTISGLLATLDQPEFATAIGLVKFGSFQEDRRKPQAPWSARVREGISRMFQRH